MYTSELVQRVYYIQLKAQPKGRKVNKVIRVQTFRATAAAAKLLFEQQPATVTRQMCTQAGRSRSYTY